MIARRMALTLSVFVAGVVLVGCRSNMSDHSTEQMAVRKGESSIIVLPPEQLAAVAGEHLELRVQALSREYEFQWQKNGQDIKGERGDNLDFKKVTLKNAGLYRCRIYRLGETAETIYTVPVALFVTSRFLILDSIHTPVAGPFQPNQLSLTSRCDSQNYTSYVRFIWPGPTVWYTPKAGVTTCTVTDTSNVGAGYSAQVEVVESGTLKKFCGTGTPSSTSFPVTAGKKYQFVIFVHNTPPPPSAGQTLSLDIVWN